MTYINFSLEECYVEIIRKTEKGNGKRGGERRVNEKNCARGKLRVTL